jgi:hypothetical protein
MVKIEDLLTARQRSLYTVFFLESSLLKNLVCSTDVIMVVVWVQLLRVVDHYGGSFFFFFFLFFWLYAFLMSRLVLDSMFMQRFSVIGIFILISLFVKNVLK